MTDKSPRLEGQEWQRWATQLLHAHYRPGEYQEVPDKKDGDAGIEGYSLNGCAYQMYGPEGDLSFAQRHEKLRNKMSRDINKFIKNRDKLERLLGTQKIKRWILFVPSFESRELVEHAAKKTKEIVEADLPYIDKSDFKVVVLNENAFAKERAHLLRHAVANIVVQAEPITETDIESWSGDNANTSHLVTLDTKIARMPTMRTEPQRKKFRREIIRYLLHGQNVLEVLRSYPEIWTAIRRAKSERERYLWTQCMSSGEAAGSILQDAIEQIQEDVKRHAAALSAGDIEAVAHEAVADWLTRCPLDFPEPKENE